MDIYIFFNGIDLSHEKFLFILVAFNIPSNIDIIILNYQPSLVIESNNETNENFINIFIFSSITYLYILL